MRTTRTRYRGAVLVVTLLTVSWLAAPVAAAPLNPVDAVDDNYTTAEDTPLEVAAPGILANDTEANGRTLTVLDTCCGPNHGTLDWRPDGAFRYVPDANFHGTDGFRYLIGNGMDEDDATVIITVTAVNDPPVAVDDAYTLDEDTPLSIVGPGILGNDTDIEGDPLQWALIVASPTHGDLVAAAANGSFTYVPDPDFNGTDEFRYRASDGTDLSNVGVVTLTVNPLNDAPVAVDDEYSVAEDGVLTVDEPGHIGNDTDVDGDMLIWWTVPVWPTHGTLVPYPGAAGVIFEYTPHPDFHGVDEFTYTAWDGALESNVATVTINVRSVNDPPVAHPDAYSVDEDQLLTVPVPGILGNDTDVEGDPLTAVLDVAPSDGTLALRPNGSFAYEPDPNFHGTDSFGYHANDGRDDSAVVRVTITVDPVNDRPVAMPDSYRVIEDGTLTVAAPGLLDNDYDVDGDTLRAIQRSDPSHGAVTAFNSDGSFTYEPDAGYVGPDSFRYRVRDGALNSNTVVVSIEVLPGNEAPTAVADEYEVAKNGELVIAAPGVLGNDTDPDGDTLKAVLDTAPIHGTLALNADGSFKYTPDAGYVGVDGFRYHANDGLLDSNIVRVVIHVKYACNGQIATIVGTSGDDTLTGTAGDDIIAGLKGKDTIHGLGGNDLICGGGSGDTIFGDAGNDRIFGGGGNDVIEGGPGNDRIEGWAGKDRLFGNDGNDFLKGEGKNDLLKGGAGDDTLHGGKGYDRLFGNRHNDLLLANDGMADKLNGGRGSDTARVDSGLDIWTSIETIL